MKQVKELDQRRQAYQATFDSETGKEVLKDLAVFCGAAKSSFDSDPLKMAFREGRREVWLRIKTQLNITEDDIWNLFNQEKNQEDYDYE